MLIYFIEMSNDVLLYFDTSAVNTINTKKVMVAVPLLYIFMVTHPLRRPTISFKYSGSSKEPRNLAKDCLTSEDVCFF